MGRLPGNDAEADRLASRLTQIISTKDPAVMGARILQAVDELKPDAATLGKAILRYRQSDFRADPQHLLMAHQLMRIPLDALSAIEQARTQKKTVCISTGIAGTSLVFSVLPYVVALIEAWVKHK